VFIFAIMNKRRPLTEYEQGWTSIFILRI
jgi:hypothetical protein